MWFTPSTRVCFLACTIGVQRVCPNGHETLSAGAASRGNDHVNDIRPRTSSHLLAL
jgi:hypothetical protein